MTRLFKMDLYRLMHSKMMWISAIAVMLFQALTVIVGPFITDWAAMLSGINTSGKIYYMTFADQLIQPFQTFMIILMFVSAVSFIYADLADGYIKNIAGQVPKKGYTAISKYLAVIIHNFIFMFFGMFGSTLGAVISPRVNMNFNMSAVPEALFIFFVKLLLTMAMCSIIIFVSTGLRSKTFASVLAVLFGVSALSLVYAMINNLLRNIDKSIDITRYAPDQLFETLAPQTAVTGIIVAVIFSIVFMVLTVKVINSRDVK